MAKTWHSLLPHVHIATYQTLSERGFRNSSLAKADSKRSCAQEKLKALLNQNSDNSSASPIDSNDIESTVESLLENVSASLEAASETYEDDARKRKTTVEDDVDDLVALSDDSDDETIEASADESDEEVAEEAPVAEGPDFKSFEFPQAVQKAIDKMGFEKPTEIQRQAIPVVLSGKDLVATAQTGTGKTAAFSLPILTRMLNEENPRRALIIAPTRELAEQIAAAIRDFTFFTRRFRYATIIGGSAYGKQLSELRARPYFVIGTPGRLNDHIDRGTLRLEEFGTLVIDEADRLLDMGFEPQIEQIVKGMPKDRQTLMFSATLPPEVKKLVQRYLTDPARIAIGEQNRPVDRIKQDVIELREDEKNDVLLRELGKVSGTAIIFTRTKARADQVARLLNDEGHEADSLHGDLTQGQRRRVTMAFRDERIRFLVATDIAARGLDISHIEHVINYDLPMMPEDYIHRIGRTARAGKEGHSIAFINSRERNQWFRILKLMGLPVPAREGFTRDRGGRRNDGKYRSSRPERGGERGFFARKAQDFGDRDDRSSRFGGSPERGPRPERISGGEDRGPRPASRPMSRPSSGPSPRGRSERFGSLDRNESFDGIAEQNEKALRRAERSERAERPERPLRQAERFPAPTGPNRAERRAAKFANLTDGTGERPARKPRFSDSEERPARRPRFSEVEERPVRKSRFSDGGGDERPARRPRFEDEGGDRPVRRSRFSDSEGAPRGERSFGGDRPAKRFGATADRPPRKRDDARSEAAPRGEGRFKKASGRTFGPIRGGARKPAGRSTSSRSRS